MMMFKIIFSFASWFSSFISYYQNSYFDPVLAHYLRVELIQWPWLMYLIVSVLMVFMIPLLIFLLIYSTAVTMYVYRHRQELELKRLNDYASKKNWRGLLHMMAIFWEAHGRIWHGYEIEGFENIPNEGPALIIYYHGTIPIDSIYLNIKCYLYKKRIVYAIGDFFHFWIPFWGHLLREIKVFTGPQEKCIALLNEGNLVSISPGGAREALFGDERYQLIWKNRIGFAKVAYQAQVPIIPVFTQNIREAFVPVKFGKKWLEMIYERFRFPSVPVYGGFPVKLRTYVGKPIEWDPNVNPVQLARKTKEAIEELIEKHQRVPGSITQALLDRIHECQSCNKCDNCAVGKLKNQLKYNSNNNETSYGNTYDNDSLDPQDNHIKSE